MVSGTACSIVRVKTLGLEPEAVDVMVSVNVPGVASNDSTIVRVNPVPEVLNMIGLTENDEVTPLGNPETLRVAVSPPPLAAPDNLMEEPWLTVPDWELKETEVVAKFAKIVPDPPITTDVDGDDLFKIASKAGEFHEARKYELAGVATIL
jgi:hypothetical protein